MEYAGEKRKKRISLFMNAAERAEDARVYQRNQSAIDTANYEVLRRASGIIALLTAPVCAANCALGQWQLAVIHAILVILSFAIFVYCRYLGSHAEALPSVIALMYGYVYVIFALSIVLAYYVTPQGGITMFAVATFAVALTILDRPGRMWILYGVATAILCLSAAVKLPVGEAVHDIVYCCTFALIGLLIGEYVRGIKLEGIEAYRMLAIQSHTDSLTGLANRRSLFEYLGVLEGPASEEGLSGVWMIDVDFFKEYNDHYGHQAGDDCLKKLGALMTAFGAEHDIRFFRYGGEEFLGTSTQHNYAALGELAELLLQRIIDLQIPYDCYERGHITVSIGYALVTEGRKSGYESCISHADTALYAAKRGGRCKAVGYTAEMQELTGIPGCVRTRR